MGKVITPYAFLANRRPPTPGTFTEQAPYVAEDRKEVAMTPNDIDLIDDDDDLPCLRCGREPKDPGWCPECCPNKGWYMPGDRYCEVCEHEWECEKRTSE